MYYESKDLGFAFELPDGWRHAEHILPLTFFGPKGRTGYTSQVIQLEVGTILPEYIDPKNRQKFLTEPDAEVFRTSVRGETNVVVLRKRRSSEISIVRDGVQYIIAHTNDAATLAAIARLKATFRFPTSKKVVTAIQEWANPRRQALIKVLRTGSPEEALQLLDEAGVPFIRRPGYTIHDLHGEKKRWWQFWR